MPSGTPRTRCAARVMRFAKPRARRKRKPRERLGRLGPAALSDCELIALILGSGCSGLSAEEIASAVAASFPRGPGAGDLAGLANLKGLGVGRAAALLAAAELGRRWAERPDPRPHLDTPGRVAQFVPAKVKSAAKEHLYAFYLDGRSRLLHGEVVSVGTLTASLVHPREVFSPAVQHSAAALIVAHNHPSGDCTPSAEDREATRRLSRCGELLGIPLLDHLVVSTGSFFSFKEAGFL